MSIIQDIFDSTPKMAMYEALRRFKVDVQPSRRVEWAYVATTGKLVVTVMEHEIVEKPGELTYLIPTMKWETEQPWNMEKAQLMRKLLTEYAGQKVYTLLIRSRYAGLGRDVMEQVGIDLSSWSLEQLNENDFMLRRKVAV